MASRKKTIVTIETHSLSVIHPIGSPIERWCASCAAVAPMVTPETAARLNGTTVRAIYQRIEADKLHFIEIATGDLLVCCWSLRLQPARVDRLKIDDSKRNPEE